MDTSNNTSLKDLHKKCIHCGSKEHKSHTHKYNPIFVYYYGGVETEEAGETPAQEAAEVAAGQS